jgi:TP901 family phage tail tape measure protein
MSVSVGQAYITIIPTTKGIAGQLQRQIVNPAVAAGDKASQAITKSFSRISAGSSLFKGIAVGLGALSLAAANMGSEFQKHMRIVQLSTGASAQEMTTMAKNAQYMGTIGVGSANAVALAYEKMARAGLNQTEISQAGIHVMKFARATNIDVADAAKIAANHIKEFGLAAEQIPHSLGVMARLVKTAGVDVQDLAEAFKYAAPTARTAGQSFETTAAIVGRLGKAGISGTMAGTAIRRVFTQILQESHGFQSVDELSCL